MAKKKNTKLEQQKPKEILELEKEYNLIIKESASGPPSYNVNSKGFIIKLDLSLQSITDIRPIEKFEYLEYLNLTRNKIEDISPISNLTSLQVLYLGGNKIKELSPVLSLNRLNTLAIWGNPLISIPILSDIKNLKRLYCSELNLNSLEFIKKNTELVDLSAHTNNISDLSPLIGLDKLVELDIPANQIRSVSYTIAKRFEWLTGAFGRPDGPGDFIISLSGNPLEFPPTSVIELGPKVVQNYYEAAEKFDYSPLSEGRIIVIGDGESGKSSLIDRALYNRFDKHKNQTNGIRIEDWALKHEDGRDLKFHFWDFGGQEIQHAVHKFFFTEGCLYVLVLDNRKEEEPEYWLQQIESLGGKAPVMVVFNKQDQNKAETIDRKYLREKYQNIVGYYATSCSTGDGIDTFKKDLEEQVRKLKTVNEQFPNNWLTIKKEIVENTTGEQHYLSYETYKKIAERNLTEQEEAQKLLLKYFNTIGTVTWFGEHPHLGTMHVLNPAWITQGVYKILTAKKTATSFGQINVRDFPKLLAPKDDDDYTYEKGHFGYILAMMKKFELCHTEDEEHLLIPSAFGKIPKVEYSDYKGSGVHTYILQFKDYMPIALIHRFIVKNLENALDGNYWYTGIVLNDSSSHSQAMVHADKKEKRIYIKIKSSSPLGHWERIRGAFKKITKSYAKIEYEEAVAVDENVENNVKYDDLISYLQADKPLYFHTKLKKEFNVGYLIGLFEDKKTTLEKIEKNEIIQIKEHRVKTTQVGAQAVVNSEYEIPPIKLTILNNNSPTVNTNINNQINIDIDIQVVNTISNDVRGEADYLLGELSESNKDLKQALEKVIQFADDAKAAQNSGDVKGLGWGRKLKSVIRTLANAGEQVKNIEDGRQALGSILKGMTDLAQQFNLSDIVNLLKDLA